MNLLPQMGSEDLDQGNLEGRDLSVHENTRKIQLHLETNINVRSINGRRPPHGETSVWNLRKTRSLGVGQFFELHRICNQSRTSQDVKKTAHPRTLNFSPKIDPPRLGKQFP